MTIHGFFAYRQQHSPSAVRFPLSAVRDGRARPDRRNMLGVLPAPAVGFLRRSGLSRHVANAWCAKGVRRSPLWPSLVAHQAFATIGAQGPRSPKMARVSIEVARQAFCERWARGPRFAFRRPLSAVRFPPSAFRRPLSAVRFPLFATVGLVPIVVTCLACYQLQPSVSCDGRACPDTSQMLGVLRECDGRRSGRR